MSVLSRAWLWLPQTTADHMAMENLSLYREMSTALVFAGRRPERRWPRWMVG